MMLTLTLFKMLVFPGLLFLVAFGLAAQFIDRKLYARLQNRVGPPWFQPVADLIKLLAKESVLPEDAHPGFFVLMPIVAFAAAVTASFYIPIWSTHALYHFTGDLVVVLYLLTIPTMTFFLAGWFSTSLFSMIGAVRSLTQLFAYEVPLFMSVLAPAILADTWSLSGMTKFYNANPEFMLFNLIGFMVALIALLGKLEKVPFDIPEAETEIVGGAFTEYSGWLLAVFRTAIDVEMVVGASLLAAVFLPFGMNLPREAVFALYLGKVVFVVVLISILRTIFARLRIEQMVDFCWKYVAPAAFLQILINLIAKGLLRT